MTSGGKPRPLLGKLTSHGGGGRGGSRVQRGNGREGTGRVEWMIMFVLVITVFSTRLDNNRSRDRDSHTADVPKRLGPTNHELSRLQERIFFSYHPPSNIISALLIADSPAFPLLYFSSTAPGGAPARVSLSSSSPSSASSSSRSSSLLHAAPSETGRRSSGSAQAGLRRASART